MAHNNARKENFDKGYSRIFGEKKEVEPSRDRFYFFTLSDGSSKSMTMKEAFAHSDPAVKTRIDEIRANVKNRRTRQDGFTAGWQENIQEYCGGRKEYDQRLKDKGLVEIGNDYIPTVAEEIHPCANKEFIKSAQELGVDVSDELGKDILSGKVFEE